LSVRKEADAQVLLSTIKWSDGEVLFSIKEEAGAEVLLYSTVSFRERQMLIRRVALTVRNETDAEVVLNYQEEAVDEGGIDCQGRGKC
jgi:hypothetical protein